MRIVIIISVVLLVAGSIWLILGVTETPQTTGVSSSLPLHRNKPEPSKTGTLSEVHKEDPKEKAVDEAEQQVREMLAEKYSLPNLVKTVREETDDSRVLMALQHIQSRHTDEAEKAYITLIDDKDLAIKKRAYAINALGALKTPAAKEKLKSLAEDGSNILLALTAIGALAQYQNEEIIEFLKELANKTDNAEIRRKCFWSMNQTKASLENR